MHAGSSPCPTRSEHSVHLYTFFVVGVELRDVERAARDAVLTADAVLLVEVDDAVRVLDDGAVGRARAEAARVLAVHALVLAHEPHQRAVVALVLVELDQVPVVPRRRGHRLVGVVEGGLAERQVVPLDAGDLARLAADAGRHVDVLGRLPLPAARRGRERCPDGPEMALICSGPVGTGYALLQLHEEALELRRVGVGVDDRRREQVDRSRATSARRLPRCRDSPSGSGCRSGRSSCRRSSSA